MGQKLVIQCCRRKNCKRERQELFYSLQRLCPLHSDWRVLTYYVLKAEGQNLALTKLSICFSFVGGNTPRNRKHWSRRGAARNPDSTSPVGRLIRFSLYFFFTSFDSFELGPSYWGGRNHKRAPTSKVHYRLAIHSLHSLNYRISWDGICCGYWHRLP